MHEQGWGQGGMGMGWGHGGMGGMGEEEKMAMKMMIWKQLNPEQQRMVMLRMLDLKLREKEFKIYMMKEKIKFMEEKLNIFRMIRDMIGGGR